MKLIIDCMGGDNAPLEMLKGVIAAKGIHQQTAKERKKLPQQEDLYIDIGTNSREESEALIRRGDFGVFDTPFCCFGKDGGYMCSSAVMFSTVPKVDGIIDDECAKYGRYDTLKFD